MGNEADGDHLVSITFPHKSESSIAASRDSVSASASAKGRSKKKKLSNPVSLDDVFLSFESSRAAGRLHGVGGRTDAVP